MISVTELFLELYNWFDAGGFYDLKLHVVSLEVVALRCVIGGDSLLAEQPCADNTDTVPLKTRLHGAISNMTATSHLCLLLWFFFFSQE